MAKIAIEEIDAALHELLTTMEAQPRAASRQGPKAASEAAGELMDDLQANVSVELRALVERPTFAACWQGIRKLGTYLDSAGGFAAMQDALDRVSAMNPDLEQHRVTVMDRAWNGIGTWIS